MVYTILASSYTDEVYTLVFDPAASSLETISSLAVGHHPSWIAFHPDDDSLVFAGLEQADGKIVALKYDNSGKGKAVAETSSGGADPCSFLATKDHMYIANYSAGVLSQIPISSKPPYLFGPSRLKTIKLNGSGPNVSRQDGSHPHQVVVHEGHGELLVPDLGADVVRRYKLTDDGLLCCHGHIQYALGGGPRHIVIQDGYLYTLLELNNTLVKHRLPASPNLPTLLKSASTMTSQPPPPTEMLAAEVLIPVSNSAYPTPYIYVSNRNDPSPEGDIISIFDTETLELVKEVRSGLHHLRGMAFGGMDDRWLVAGGVNGGGVKVFERVEGGRDLRVVAENVHVKAPTGFLWK